MSQFLTDGRLIHKVSDCQLLQKDSCSVDWDDHQCRRKLQRQYVSQASAMNTTMTHCTYIMTCLTHSNSRSVTNCQPGSVCGFRSGLTSVYSYLCFTDYTVCNQQQWSTATNSIAEVLRNKCDYSVCWENECVASCNTKSNY